MPFDNQPQHALINAVFKLLRPLVRILLRNGLPYGAFADIAKRAYADVAMKEFVVEGKKQTNSRVSTITGLSRKEIQRLLASIETIEQDTAQESVTKYNRAARVVYGWVHDSEFSDADGNTAVLPFESPNKETQSFSALVKKYSGDIPPRAILDELQRVGVVELEGQQNVRLLARAYIPTTGASEKLALLGRDVAGLISTMDLNIHHVTPRPLFQRKVFYDNLPDAAVLELQQILAEKGQSLLEFFDQWMAAHDRDVNPDIKGTGQHAAGIGIYFFEEETVSATSEELKHKKENVAHAEAIIDEALTLYRKGSQKEKDVTGSEV